MYLLSFLSLICILARLGNAEENVIEEKLEELGVEKGSGSNSTIPHIHAPHVRAASVCCLLSPLGVPLIVSVVFQAQQTPEGAEFLIAFPFRFATTIPTRFQ
jgi:hypothetical protein